MAKYNVLILSFFTLITATLSAQDRPNILWIVAEDISPFFGVYGNPDADTPHIDAYAKGSHVFLNAWTTAPICAPSRSALATGMYATSLGTQNLRSDVPRPNSIKPLPQIFKENGYWTALRGKTDYNFDPAGLFDYWETDEAPWRQNNTGKPFFAFMNLGSTHEGSGNMAERADPALERLAKDRFHDPKKVSLPPYFPDTPEMRRIWARYHDLISVWDQDVHAVLERLEADGKADDTIVFLMADHGLGLPRYKRWLYKTGLHVPLIIHIPEKFRAFSPGGKMGTQEDGPVSYIDLPPTALTLAGITVPDNFHGSTILKKNADSTKHRDFVFGARDRADDMYDLSRSVYDGRYLYIRHYMPHLPPIQEGFIFSPQHKESLMELHRVHNAKADTKISQRLWSPRPYEELYDLKNDPQELENIATDPKLSEKKDQLASVLLDWILRTRDSAFLTEPEMHRRAQAAKLTPYEMMQDAKLFPLEAILNIANMASKMQGDGLEFYTSQDPAIRYWALMAGIMAERNDERARTIYRIALKDPNPIVRTTAAEALGRISEPALAIPVFRELLKEPEPNLGLFVARAIAVSLEDARPLENEIRQKRDGYLAPPGSSRPWKDFLYSAFSTWALEWALIKSDLNKLEDFNN
jgi:N-sulfoglucosamine sulfohydrolase